jgi:predicted kinase
MKMIVYILVGLIGSGKSTWAREKAKEDNTIIINKDVIRQMFKGEYFFHKDYEHLVDQMSKACFLKALQKGYNVIIDETNITKKKRAAYVEAVKEHYYMIDEPVEFEIVWFPEKRNNIENRMKEPRGYTQEQWEAVLRGMKSAFEEPELEELSIGGRLRIMDKWGEIVNE